MLAPLLQTDPSSPRLTVYDDSRGVRMDFSAQTLDNWASKVANMLDDEFDLAPDGSVAIDRGYVRVEDEAPIDPEAETGVDGFNVSAAVRPADLERFAALVSPELRRRGVLREPEPGRTLRENVAGAGPLLPEDHRGARFR